MFLKIDAESTEVNVPMDDRVPLSRANLPRGRVIPAHFNVTGKDDEDGVEKIHAAIALSSAILPVRSGQY